MKSAAISAVIGDAVTGEIEKMFVGLDDQRNVAPGRFDDQRAEHDQESHRERGEGGDQRVADRLQPQPVPAARLDHGIGAVQRDPQRLDAVGGEVDRSTAPTVRMSPRVVVSTSWISPDIVSATCSRPGLQQQRRRPVGELLRAEKAR